MIKKIMLENFKCFQSITADMGKITLLTGANSSGKSSFLHSILLLMQSTLYPFDVSINGQYVQLGGLKELSFNHDTAAMIRIGYVIKLHPIHTLGEVEIVTKWKKSVKGNSLALYGLTIGNGRASLDLKISADTWIISISLPGKYIRRQVKNNQTNYYHEHRLGGNPNQSYENGMTIISITNIPLNADIRDSLQSISYLYDEEIESIRKQGFNDLDMLLQAIEQFRWNKYKFNYINSYELPPVRTYYQTSNYGSLVKSDGDGFEQQLLFWSEVDDLQLKRLKDELKNLKAVSNIMIKHLSGGRFEIRVRAMKGKLSRSLVDVGFGISQLLPILVADIQLEKDSILAISQPERHLHPSMQADLMDYFITNRSKKQYVIESHSEYMINRLRLRIAEGKINPNDVKCYYFENDGFKTIEHLIKFNKDGSISDAPKSFFDTYLCDSMQIALTVTR